MKTLKLTALFMALLMVVTPITLAQQITGGAVASQGFQLDVQAPRYVRQPKVTITGTTAPNADLEVFMGTTKVRISQADADGNINIQNIPLSAINNAITVKAFDDLGNAQEASLQVTLDRTPPQITLTDAPSTVTSPSVTINGETDEPVTLYYIAQSMEDLTPPTTLVGLTTTTIEENKVELSWGPSAADDLLEYAIYRDGERIAISNNPSYSDDTASSGNTYVYSVSGVDNNCNEGPKSLGVTVTTLSGGNEKETPDEAQLSCEAEAASIQVSSPFTISVPVSPGQNRIRLTAVDTAGNQAVLTHNVFLDVGPPTFIDTNLEEIGTTYIPLVTVRGQTSEPAAVHIYVNDHVEEIVTTDDQGFFEKDIELKTDVAISTAQGASLDTGQGWKNEIKLVAIDGAGFESQPYGPVEVIYALCGFGNWYDVDLLDAMPSNLLPRMILQGTQQINIPFTLKYIGGNQPELNVYDVKAIRVAMSPELERYYDNSMVVTSTFATAQSETEAVGMIQIKFNPFDPAPDTQSTWEKEHAISEYRKGDAEAPAIGATTGGTYYRPPETCTIPGLGCFRFYLELEIPFKEKIAQTYRDPQTNQVLGTRTEDRSQRTCLANLEFTVDPVLPPEYAPSGTLMDVAEFLTEAIDFIDGILEPVTTIGTYLLYACLANSAVIFVMEIAEKWNCDVSSELSAFDTAGGKWHKDIAEAGLCEEVYDFNNLKNPDENKEDVEKLQNYCMDCQTAIKNRVNVMLDYFQPICDRVTCPKAPSLQMNIRQQAGKAKKITDKVDAELKRHGVDKTVADIIKDLKLGTAPDIYKGNSCGLGKDFVTDSFTGIPPATSTSSSSTGVWGIKKMYDEYKTYKGKSDEEEVCKRTVHPASPRCCPQEYYWEWNSACGVGDLVGVTDPIDMFDELKNSYCLGAQKAGQAQASECSIGIWNAVAGFCEPDSGNPRPDAIYTDIRFEANQVPGSRDQTLYLFVKPLTGTNRRGSQTAPDYSVHLGYVADTARYQALPAGQQAPAGQTHQLTSTISEIHLSTEDLSELFWKETENEKVTNSRTLANKIRELPVIKTQANDDAVRSAYNRVDAVIGIKDIEYVVDPSDSLLRSFQCICFPGFISHLEMWRGIMIAARGCFADAATTGEMESGVCRNFLSTTICEVLWEVISCAINKLSSPPSKGGTRATGIEGLLSTITSAADNTASSVRGRYGETSMWNALFNEKKLVHGLCMWAFTGDWDLDVSAAFSQGVQNQQVESIVQVGPLCQRRFLGYNPASSPIKGLTNWEYRIPIFMMPGSDVRYNLKLKCSTGFGCSTADGYPGGECDCNQPGEEKIITVSSPELGTGTRQRLETLDADVQALVQSTEGRRAERRYDKAIFEYSWQDEQTNSQQTRTVECTIVQMGDAPPAFCSFDLFRASYRCSWGEQEGAIRILSAAPISPRYKGTTPAFGTDHTLQFDLTVRQEMPDDPTLTAESKKFVLYELRNQNGRVIMSKTAQPGERLTSAHTLETNGDHNKLIPMPRAITNADFGTATGTTAAGGYQIQPITWASSNLGIVGQRKAISAWTAQGTTKNFVVVIKKSGNNNVYTLHEAATTGTYGAQGYGEGAAISNVDKSYTQGQLITETIPPNFGGGQVTFKIDETIRSPLAATDRIEVAIYRQTAPTGSTNPCTSKNPVPWEITFQVYDANEYGQLGIKSVDPATGRTVEYKETFNAVCDAHANLLPSAQQPAAATPPTQQTPPAQTGALCRDPLGSGGNCKQACAAGESDQGPVDCPQNQVCCIPTTII